MKILLITDAYPPEIRSASHLMQELAEELRDRGHSVTVVSCYPRYNLAGSSSRPVFDQLSIEKGVRVIRLHTLPHHKVNFIVRGISQLTVPHIFCHTLKRHLKHGVDAVLVYSPPLPLWRVGFQVRKTYGAKFILNIQDIFPQNAIDLGALRNPILIKFFEEMEKAAYRNADIVTVHSPSNRELLIREKGVLPDKLFTLHNWADTAPYNSHDGPNGFRKRLGLENKFVLFFGGVMGPSQGLDVVIEAARELRGIKDLAILLVGDGTERENLQRKAHAYDLENVIFYPFVSKTDYQALLKEVDVGLVCLTTKNKTPVVPGKIQGYMAAAVPVLSLLNKESDGHQIIREAKCGYSGISDNAQKAAGLMLKMYQERAHLRELGINGHRYAEANFSKAVCINRLEELLQR